MWAKRLITIAGAIAFCACGSSDTLSPSEQSKFRISGRFIAYQSIDISGIQVNAGANTAITDTNGQYLLSSVIAGTYILKPYRQGLIFTPESLTIHVKGQDVPSQNFIVAKSLSSDSSSANMKAIVGGTFLMGSNNDDQEERPSHLVSIKSFEIAKHEVTQKQWQELMGSNPSQFINSQHPVERVSWHDAIAYCNALSISEGFTPAYLINGDFTTCDFNANGYRLPTEAEWEYACRAGTTTDYYSGNRNKAFNGCYEEAALTSVGWYCNNASSTTHPVGQKQPNSFGLFDMHGNVFEWCWDWSGDYPSVSQTNPTGPNNGSLRICRGGSWFYVPQQSRSSFRLAYQPSSKYSGVGFRVVRSTK